MQNVYHGFFNLDDPECALSMKHKGVSLTREAIMTPRVHFQLQTQRDPEGALTAKDISLFKLRISDLASQTSVLGPLSSDL